jgi:hypothetical protein
MTANLQGGFTIKQAAAVMNVSERMVYMARELMQTGRADLCAAVESGKLTILAALKEAKPERYCAPDRAERLRRLWNSLSEAERADFIAWAGLRP